MLIIKLIFVFIIMLVIKLIFVFIIMLIIMLFWFICRLVLFLNVYGKIELHKKASKSA